MTRVSGEKTRGKTLTSSRFLEHFLQVRQGLPSILYRGAASCPSFYLTR